MNFNDYHQALDDIKAPSKLKQKTLTLMNERQKAMKPKFKTFKVVLITAIILVLSSISIFGISLFSSIDGDDLKLNSKYNGNGIITISVENLSEKTLKFQKDFRLMLFNSSKEVQPIDKNKIVITGIEIFPKSSGKIKIDISKAYNITELEKPLINDHYYLILTNNNFLHGQDWHCTVKFAETIIPEKAEIILHTTDSSLVKDVENELKFYFEKPYSYDLEQKYITAYQKILEKFDGNIVKSICPKHLIITTKNEKTQPIFDKEVPADQQEFECWGEYFDSYNQCHMKRLATTSECALQIQAFLPDKQYADTSITLPLFYVMTYEKSSISSPNDYAFIYGNLLTFDELEDIKIYEDDKYICYEISSLIYSDLDSYIDDFVKARPEAVYNDQIKERVHNVYNYFKQNMSKLFYYRQNTQ